MTHDREVRQVLMACLESYERLQCRSHARQRDGLGRISEEINPEALFSSDDEKSSLVDAIARWFNGVGDGAQVRELLAPYLQK